MSFGKRIVGEGTERWDSSVDDIFDGMKKVALRFDGSRYLAVFILSLIFSQLFLALYLLFTNKIHTWNRNSGCLGFLILSIDHLFFGLGFVPMIASFVEMQWCNDHGHLSRYTSQKCWSYGHVTLLSLAFSGASVVVIMSAVVCPLLRHERGGLERKWNNEDYFPTFFKLLTVGIIYIPAGIHKPFPGIAGCSALILYLCWSQAYRDNHLAAVKMGVLWGQLWVFISAQVVVSSGNEMGSRVLIGWAPAIVFGYLLQWAIWLFFRKKPSSDAENVKQD